MALPNKLKNLCTQLSSSTSRPVTRSVSNRATSSPALNFSSILTQSYSTSNNDLIVALSTLRTDFLSTTKAISEAHTLQFNEIKSKLKDLCSLIAEFISENSIFRNEIDYLIKKVAILESKGSQFQASHIVTQVLQETFERAKCESNIIAYSFPESHSLSVPESIAEDRVARE